jgi:hypothetical protein
LVSDQEAGPALLRARLFKDQKHVPQRHAQLGLFGIDDGVCKRKG